MWEQVKMPNRHFLRSDIFTVAMVYSFYFLFVGSRRNECNSLWGWIRGRGQKSTTYSENISVIKFYLSTLTLHLQWSIIFIFCVLVPHGMNVIVFGKEMGKEPESYDLFWYCLRDAVNADKIISSAIIVYNKFTTILWQYIIFLFWLVYLSSKQ